MREIHAKLEISFTDGTTVCVQRLLRRENIGGPSFWRPVDGQWSFEQGHQGKVLAGVSLELFDRECARPDSNREPST